MEEEILANSHRVLRYLRLNTNDRTITQDKVAAAIGMSKSSYHQLEAGKRNMYLLDMVRIARFYSISLADLARMLERSPAEIEKIGELQLALDEALTENAKLKTELDNAKSFLK